MVTRPAAATARTGIDPTTGEIDAAWLSVARVMFQPRVHAMLRKQARVELDRAGAAVLYKLVSEGENIRLCDLADRVGVDSPAITRKVKQLEAEGFLNRQADPDDGRASRLTLTRAGRSAIERLLQARRRWIQALLSSWPNEDKEMLAHLLQRFASTIDEDLRAGHGR